jgi:hypothetical protein
MFSQRFSVGRGGDRPCPPKIKGGESAFLSWQAVPCWLLAIGIGAALLGGCAQGGGSSQSTSQPPQVVAISSQPASQTVPIGRTGTFSVVASGTGPLQYQWSENGVPISGATSASYTTPVVALSDSGETLQVTVSNSISSVASAVATLTPGPRAPALGDLRYLLFEQVTAAGLLQDGGLHTDIPGSADFSSNNGIGTPFTIGTNFACDPEVEYDCAWVLTVYNLPAGQLPLSMYYESNAYPSFASEVQSVVAPNVVIDSIDLEPANNEYAIAYVETAQTGGFDYRLEVVPPDQLQATVANDGAESRVVTAASFDANNQANVISYGWTGDTTTVYEAQTIVADSASEIASQAETLAADGYFISAFGGNDTDGYMLIGMRVQGDTVARPISVTMAGPSGSSSFSTLPAQSPPYATEVIAGGFFGSFTTAGSQIYVSEE